MKAEEADAEAELRRQCDPASVGTADRVPTAAQLSNRLEVLRGPRFVADSNELTARMEALSASLPAELGLPPPQALAAPESSADSSAAGGGVGVDADVGAAAAATVAAQLLEEAAACGSNAMAPGVALSNAKTDGAEEPDLLVAEAMGLGAAAQ